MKQPLDNTIDQMFREGLSELKVSPPDDIWTNIRQEIQPAPRKRRGGFWIWMAAAAIAFAATAGVTLLNQSGYFSGNASGNSLASGPDQHPAVSNGNSGAKIAAETPASLEAAPENGGPAAPANAPVISPDRSPLHQAALPAFAAKEEKDVPVRDKAFSDLKLSTFAALPAAFAYPEAKGRIAVPEFTPLETEEGFDESEWIVIEDDGRKNGKKVRLQMGGMAGPEFAYSEFSPQNGLALADPSAAAAPEKRIDPGFSTGIRFGVGVSDRIDLQTGMLYAYRNGSPDLSNPLNRSYVSQVEDATAIGFNASQQSLAATSGNYQASYLEIPVQVKYSFRPDKKLDFYLNPGVSGAFFLDYAASQEVAGEQITADVSGQTFRPAQLNLLVSGGVELNFSEAFSMNVEPAMKYGAASNSFAFQGANATRFGLNSGLFYRF